MPLQLRVSSIQSQRISRLQIRAPSYPGLDHLAPPAVQDEPAAPLPSSPLRNAPASTVTRQTDQLLHGATVPPSRLLICAGAQSKSPGSWSNPASAFLMRCPPAP